MCKYVFQIWLKNWVGNFCSLLDVLLFTPVCVPSAATTGVLVAPMIISVILCSNISLPKFIQQYQLWLMVEMKW